MTTQEAAAQLAAVTEALKSLPEDIGVIACGTSSQGPMIQVLHALPVPAETSEIKGQYLHSSAMLGSVNVCCCRLLSPSELETVRAATIAALAV